MTTMSIVAPRPSTRPRRSSVVRAVPVTPRRTRPRALHLTRRGRLVLFLLAAALTTGLLVSVALATGLGVGAVRGSVTFDERPVLATVTVNAGDTLWAIAHDVAPGTDPRDTVTRLRELNGLSPRAALTAGQELVVPARD